jgi:molybdopterin-guanine dinucleotide biosynthesis protein A
VRSAVLAGGAASRFGGRPKGLEMIGGVRVLDRVVEAVIAATGSPPTLIANAPEAVEWRPGLVVAEDVIRHRGSLGGILTAVTAGEGPVLVLGWDMPFIATGILGDLVAHSAGHDVFLPESNGPLGVEPLCGVYGPACEDPIRRSIENEDLRTTAFHSEVRAGTLPLERTKTHGDPKVLFFNVNDSDDLARAETLWREQHAATS